jgi:hypothetical protein
MWDALAVMVITIAVLLTAFWYKDDLKKLLSRVQALKVGAGGIEITTWRDNLNEKGPQYAKQAGIVETEAGREVGATLEAKAKRYEEWYNREGASAREFILESWGGFRQILYDAAIAHKIQLTPATKPPETIRQMREAGLIDKEKAELMELVYELGKQMKEDPGLKPEKKDAEYFKGLSDTLMEWIMRNLIFLPTAVPSEDKRRRVTLVDDRSPVNFPRPKPGRPAATLLGLSGAVGGRRFSVDRELFRIGSAPENDLQIEGDEYMSSRHSVLRYDKGNLTILDRSSRNGTYLNHRRVTNAGEPVSPGDRIRVGSSTFEVVQSPGQ